VLFNVLEYGVELEHLVTNPILTVRWRTPKNAEHVDPRVAVNHRQARVLLDAVRQQGPTGQRLVAFFALLYYAALRPAEAADLRKSALSIPDQGWGKLYLPGSAPTTGAAWGDSGTRRDRRGLKHRPRNEVRVVPSAPPLTAPLHDHLDTFGTADDGRLSAEPGVGTSRRARTAGSGNRPGRRRSAPRRRPRRSPGTRTPSGMPRCRPGSTAVSRPPRLPGEPDTASTCSTASTPKCVAGQQGLEAYSQV